MNMLLIDKKYYKKWHKLHIPHGLTLHDIVKKKEKMYLNEILKKKGNANVTWK